MEKKKLIIAAILLVFVCAALSVGIVFAINGGQEAEKSYPLEGTWIEDSTSLEVTFTEQGVFKVMDSEAATYTFEKESANSGNLTMKYAEVYGGKNITMKYSVSETQLALTQESSGEVQTYTRKGSSNGQ